MNHVPSFTSRLEGALAARRSKACAAQVALSDAHRAFDLAGRPLGPLAAAVIRARENLARAVVAVNVAQRAVTQAEALLAVAQAEALLAVAPLPRAL